MSRMSASADTWRWSGQFSDLTSSPHGYDAKSFAVLDLELLCYSSLQLLRSKLCLDGNCWTFMVKFVWLGLRSLVQGHFLDTPAAVCWQSLLCWMVKLHSLRSGALELSHESSILVSLVWAICALFPSCLDTLPNDHAEKLKYFWPSGTFSHLHTGFLELSLSLGSCWHLSMRHLSPDHPLWESCLFQTSPISEWWRS